MQRQMEGHAAQREPKLSAVRPVHEGEEQDPTGEEAQQDERAVDSVQSGVVQAELSGERVGVRKTQ